MHQAHLAELLSFERGNVLVSEELGLGLRRHLSPLEIAVLFSVSAWVARLTATERGWLLNNVLTEAAHRKNQILCDSEG